MSNKRKLIEKTLIGVEDTRFSTFIKIFKGELLLIEESLRVGVAINFT